MDTPSPRVEPAVAYANVLRAERKTVHVARFTESADPEVNGRAFCMPSKSPLALSVVKFTTTAADADGDDSEDDDNRDDGGGRDDDEDRTPLDALYVPHGACRRRAERAPGAPLVKPGFYFHLEPDEEFQVNVHVADGRCAAVSALLHNHKDSKKMIEPMLVARLLVDGRDVGDIKLLWGLKSGLRRGTCEFKGTVNRNDEGVVTGYERLRVTRPVTDSRPATDATDAEKIVGTIEVAVRLLYNVEETVVRPPSPPATPAKCRRRGSLRRHRRATGHGDGSGNEADRALGGNDDVGSGGDDHEAVGWGDGGGGSAGDGGCDVTGGGGGGTPIDESGEGAVAAAAHGSPTTLAAAGGLPAVDPPTGVPASSGPSGAGGGAVAKEPAVASEADEKPPAGTLPPLPVDAAKAVAASPPAKAEPDTTLRAVAAVELEAAATKAEKGTVHMAGTAVKTESTAIKESGAAKTEAGSVIEEAATIKTGGGTVHMAGTAVKTESTAIKGSGAAKTEAGSVKEEAATVTTEGGAAQAGGGAGKAASAPVKADTVPPVAPPPLPRRARRRRPPPP